MHPGHARLSGLRNGRNIGHGAARARRSRTHLRGRLHAHRLHHRRRHRPRIRLRGRRHTPLLAQHRRHGAAPARLRQDRARQRVRPKRRLTGHRRSAHGARGAGVRKQPQPQPPPFLLHQRRRQAHRRGSPLPHRRARRVRKLLREAHPRPPAATAQPHSRRQAAQRARQHPRQRARRRHHNRALDARPRHQLRRHGRHGRQIRPPASLLPHRARRARMGQLRHRQREMARTGCASPQCSSQCAKKNSSTSTTKPCSDSTPTPPTTASCPTTPTNRRTYTPIQQQAHRQPHPI